MTSARPPRLDTDGAEPVLEILLGTCAVARRAEAGLMAIADAAPALDPDVTPAQPGPLIELCLGIIAGARTLERYVSRWADGPLPDGDVPTRNPRPAPVDVEPPSPADLLR